MKHLCEIEFQIIEVPARDGRDQAIFHEKGVIYRRDGRIIKWVGRLEEFKMPNAYYSALQEC